MVHILSDINGELLATRLLHADAVVEVVGEDGVDVLAGADGLVVDPASRAEAAEFFQIVVHGFEVTFAE